MPPSALAPDILLSPAITVPSMAPRKLLYNFINAIFSVYFTTIVVTTLGPPVYQLSIDSTPASTVDELLVFVTPVIATATKYLLPTSPFRPLSVGMCSLTQSAQIPYVFPVVPMSSSLYPSTLATPIDQTWVNETFNARLLDIWDWMTISVLLAFLQLAVRSRISKNPCTALVVSSTTMLLALLALRTGEVVERYATPANFSGLLVLSSLVGCVFALTPLILYLIPARLRSYPDSSLSSYLRDINPGFLGLNWISRPLSLLVKLLGLRTLGSRTPRLRKPSLQPDFLCAQNPSTQPDEGDASRSMTNRVTSSIQWSGKLIASDDSLTSQGFDPFLATTATSSKPSTTGSQVYELAPPPSPRLDIASLENDASAELDNSATLCGSALQPNLDADDDLDFDFENIGHWNKYKGNDSAPFFDLGAQLRDFQPDFSRAKFGAMMDPMFYNEDRDEMISEAEYARRRKAAKAMGTTYGPPSPGCPSPVLGRSPRKPRHPRARRSQGRKVSGPNAKEVTAQLDALLHSMAQKDPSLA